MTSKGPSAPSPELCSLAAAHLRQQRWLRLTPAGRRKTRYARDRLPPRSPPPPTSYTHTHGRCRCERVRPSHPLCVSADSGTSRCVHTEKTGSDRGLDRHQRPKLPSQLQFLDEDRPLPCLHEGATSCSLSSIRKVHAIAKSQGWDSRTQRLGFESYLCHLSVV